MGVRCYFDTFGGIDIDKYDSDEDAVRNIPLVTLRVGKRSERRLRGLLTRDMGQFPIDRGPHRGS